MAFTLIGIAVAAWVQRFPGKLTLIALALIFVGNLIWTARDYFVVWPRVDTVRFWNHCGLRAVADEAQRSSDTSPLVVCVPDNLVDERIPWWKPAWQHMRYLWPQRDVDVRYYNCVDTLLVPAGTARYAFPDAVDEATLQQFPIYTRFLAAAQPDRTELPDRLGVILKVDPTAALTQQLSVAAQSAVRFDGASETVALPIDLGGKVEFLRAPGQNVADNRVRLLVRDPKEDIQKWHEQTRADAGHQMHGALAHQAFQRLPWIVLACPQAYHRWQLRKPRPQSLA